MKLLYICRHAKSSWENLQTNDFDRPLNERGLSSAPLMASFFKGKEPNLDLIISSTALRAKETANIYNVTLQVTMQEESSLYHIDYKELFHFICALPKDLNTVAIVGHNPGLTNIINYLSNADLYNLPTAGIAAIQFEVGDWNEISADSGELLWLKSPKEL